MPGAFTVRLAVDGDKRPLQEAQVIFKWSAKPGPNSEFMQALRAAWGIRFGLPATEWILEIGAFLLRTETELILKSRRVVPGRLLESGFVFQFPTWGEAARDLCTKSGEGG